MLFAKSYQTTVITWRYFLPLFKLLFFRKALGGMEDEAWLKRSNEPRRVTVLFNFM